MAIAWLNGAWLPPEEASISVFDRGFMFGDGIYEVIAIYNGKPFALDAHLARLRRSLGEIRLDLPMDDASLQQLLTEAVSKGGESNALLYMQVTRGVALPRAHAWPDDTNPTLLITVTPAPILTRQNVTPYRLVTKEDYRWGRGDIKVISLIANVLLKNEAIAEGYNDALLIKDGKVTEATAANLFIVSQGQVITPPKSGLLLHGITRDHVLALAKDAGMAVAEREIPEAEVFAADEVWVTSTSHEVWPVSHVNGQAIGKGAPGPVFDKIDGLFQAFKTD
ncbi:MAG: D-amino acid aminotransferase [Pseudomonadales bacterium]